MTNIFDLVIKLCSCQIDTALIMFRYSIFVVFHLFCCFVNVGCVVIELCNENIRALVTVQLVCTFAHMKPIFIQTKQGGSGKQGSCLNRYSEDSKEVVLVMHVYAFS